MSLEKSIEKHLSEIGKIGADPNGGFTRLAFSGEEDEVHNYASYSLRWKGFKVKKDAFGNLIASKKGTDPSRKKVMIGTHLDTVTQGGNYDGVVGFITAIDGVKLAEKELGSDLPYGVDIVVFRAEESTRFNRACLGSSAAFGFLAPADMRELHYPDVNGDSLEDSIGYVGGDPDKIGTVLIEPSKYMAYFETHIEQSVVLEGECDPATGIIGIVTSIRAPERRSYTVKGDNALKASAEMILAVEAIATKYDEDGEDIVGTVGKVNNFFEGAEKVNSVPGRVRYSMKEFDTIQMKSEYADAAGKHEMNFKYNLEGKYIETEGQANHSGGTPMGWQRKDGLTTACDLVLVTPDEYLDAPSEMTFYSDIRSDDETTRTIVQAEVISSFRKISKKYSVELTISDPIEQGKPQMLDVGLGKKLEEAACSLEIPHLYLPSGAGHDAMKAAQAGIPTAMLFIPCKNGISHSPDEYAKVEDIGYAVRVQAQVLQILAKEQ